MRKSDRNVSEIKQIAKKLESRFLPYVRGCLVVLGVVTLRNYGADLKIWNRKFLECVEFGTDLEHRGDMQNVSVSLSGRYGG